MGTERGLAAVDRVEEAWPGYGQVAASSILNAYYTDTDVVLTVWDWLERHGVTEGLGFEPGCGRGDWIAAAPDGVRFDAVDIDPISVRVAAALTGANVVESRIEEWHLARSEQALANGGYDVVVGNVPFSSHHPGVGNPHRDNLHNLAVARSVSMLRPGGIAAVLTSRFSLDSNDSSWRRRLAAEVDLVGAFRLPSRTHREAGTDVVTDLLILRRPLPGEQRPDPAWVDVEDLALDADTTSTVNRYWHDHPDHVLGRIEPGGAYRRENFTVVSDGPAHTVLAEALARVELAWAPAGTARRSTTPHLSCRARRRVGRCRPGRSLPTRRRGPGSPRDGREHPCTAKGRHQLGLLLTMRDRVLEYLDAPTDAGRNELADLYAAYRDLYKQPLNAYELAEARSVKRRDADDSDVDEATGERTLVRRRYPKLEGFRTDPSWWSVAALEVFDDDTGEATPAPILQRPIIEATREVWPDRADTIEQAVANSLARWHRIDPDYVAGQLGVGAPETAVQLAEVAYRTPAGEWDLAAHYLAGDVVGKLDEALTAAAGDRGFVRNVDALRAVQPTPLTAAEITPEFGGDVARARRRRRVHRCPTTAARSPSSTTHRPGSGPTTGGRQPDRPGSTPTRTPPQKRSSGRATPNRSPCTSPDRSVTVRSPSSTPEATAAEQLCRDNLTEALQVWCWDDPRTGHPSRRPLQPAVQPVPGRTMGRLPPDPAGPGRRLRRPPPPERRRLADPRVGRPRGADGPRCRDRQDRRDDHRRPRNPAAPGGSTAPPLFAVPGNMVEQFARDYLRLYPAARVLTPHGATQRDAVREFAARMATGDFDAAVCSHNQLKTIPLSPDVEAEVLARRLADFETFDPNTTLSRSAARRWARQLEKEQAHLTELKQAVEDPAVTYFDRMGVGMLVVDEAHLAKNIRLNTQRQGLPMPAGSQRAEAILARTDYVRSRHGDGAIVMATATPVTNSPAEMWVAARLVAPHALADAELEHFDAMAANFLAPVETVEHGADGKLKVVTRLGEYKNFPDLARMFRSFADVRPTSSLGFQLPELVGGKPTVHVADPTPQQQTVAAWCAERAAGQHLERLDNPDPVIAILGTARAAALHPATISRATCDKYATHGHPALSFHWDEPNEKLITVAEQIAEIHHRTADWTYPDSERPGAAQVVFCDAGIPNPDGTASVYSTLTVLLTERGVARREIAWVHDIADPNRRQTLWDQVRSGKTRVLIGSTMQMGVGVNIQTRLYAAHELTAPYRPDWLEQAEGRLIRQGNNNTSVEVHRYVTERTADANSWQILQRKAHFIAQAMSDPEQMTRDLRDESVATVAEEFAAIAAIATGDQRHIELAALTAATTRLERSERAHHASRASQGRQIGDAERNIGRLTDQVAAIDALRPHDADAALIGQRLLGLRWNERTTLQLAGVTYDAHRSDGIRLEIPGTGIWTQIGGDRLHPEDEGRGLGQRILNLHHRLPTERAEHIERIDRARRQIDAERARPVPAEYPRRTELLETRQRRDQLRADLMPTPEPAPAQQAAATDPATASAGQPAAAVAGHPVFGERQPPTAERFAWAGTYDRYTTGVVVWGNRARGANAWALAVNQFSLNPDNWHPTRRHDIGQFHGVNLQARIDDTTIRIEPRHAYAKDGNYPTYDAQPGRVDPNRLAAWLKTMRDLAVTERNELRHHVQPYNGASSTEQQPRFER